MKRIATTLLTVILLIITINSCDQSSIDIENETHSGPQIITYDTVMVNYFAVTVSGKISGLEAPALDFECGIEYSTSPLFSKDSTCRARASVDYSEKDFFVKIEPIEYGVQYYYRAYYINQLYIHYGDIKNFKFDYFYGEKQCVDLGLSVKWATCNVGAEKPEDYGYYYAWGETEPKFTYSQSSYIYYYGDNTRFKKYNATDGKKQLELDDDVAHIKWGEAWRLPSRQELEELIKNCTWKWVTQDGVEGFIVTSRKKGYTDNSIFLPAAGIRYVSDSGTSIDQDIYNKPGLCLGLWSNELDTLNYSFDFHYYQNERNINIKESRFIGLSVRPVYPLNEEEKNNRDLTDIDDKDVIEASEFEKPIEFTINDNKATRAYINSNSDFANNGGIKVWGVKKYASGTNHKTVFDGDTLYSTDNGATWTYTPIRYWDYFSNYDFYAAAPAKNANGTIEFLDNTICVNNVHYAKTSDTDIECKVHRGAKILNGDNPNIVDFSLYHIMSNLVINILKFKDYGSWPYGIDKVKLFDCTIEGWNGGNGNFKLNNNLSPYDCGLSEWTIPVYSRGVLTMADNDGFYLPQEDYTIGNYLLIPQEINDQCCLKMSFKIYYFDGLAETYIKNISMKDLIPKFVTGCRYILNINIEPNNFSVDCICSTDWNSDNTTIGIE